MDPRGSIFTFFYSLLTVKSNTLFGKMIFMAVDKYSLEMEKNWFSSVLAWSNEQQQQHPCLKHKVSKALSVNIIKKILR